MSWEDLLGPDHDPAETADAASHAMALPVQRQDRHRHPELPDVGDLREQLGLDD